MAVAVFPRSGLRAPAPTAGVNWQHPLAYGLRSLLVWNGPGVKPSDLVGTRAPALVGAPTVAASPHGLIGSAASINDGWSLGTDDGWLPTDRCTIVVIRRKTDTTNRSSALFGLYGGAASTNRIGTHCPYSDGTVYWDYGGFSGGSTRLSLGGLTFSTDWEYWVFTAGRKGMAFYRNGKLLASQATAVTRSSDTTSGALFGPNVGHGESGGGTVTGDIEDIALFAVLAWEWSASDVRQWHADPFCLVHPGRIPARWLPKSLSISVPGATATLTAAGGAAGVVAGTTVSAVAAAVTSAAAAASLQTGSALTGATGSVAVAALAPVPTISVPASVAAVDVTALASGVVTGSVLTGAVGAVTVDAPAASIIGGQLINADVATVTASGLAASPSGTSLLTGAVGAIAVAALGSIPTMAVPAAVGAVTAGGLAAAPTGTSSLTGAVGAVTVAAQTATPTIIVPAAKATVTAMGKASAAPVTGSALIAATGSAVVAALAAVIGDGRPWLFLGPRGAVVRLDSNQPAAGTPRYGDIAPQPGTPRIID